MFRWTLVSIAILGVLGIGIITDVNLSTGRYRISNSASLPHENVAIVFGAHVFRSGMPSLVLHDRLEAAIALYKQGIVRKLLVSGDNRFVDYNEPDAMRAYALRHGVSQQDVIADYAGRDTYDTCYRAKHIFGVNEAILVTQAFHAPRTVYIARGVGINAVAYAVPDFDRYPGLRLPYSSREYLADVKAWWEVNISHREAQVMGPRETSLYSVR